MHALGSADVRGRGLAQKDSRKVETFCSCIPKPVSCKVDQVLHPDSQGCSNIGHVVDGEGIALWIEVIVP